ncbi:MAG TPA: histidine kinase, partial [Polyangia bacterium]
KAHDEERRQFARALHDDAQQTLAAASMSLSMLERQAGDLPAPARATLTEAMTLLARCHQELRALAERLHPPLLDELGLPTALRGLLLRLGEGRLQLTVAPHLPRFDRSVETAAFKLIDEALALLYAEPTLVSASVGHIDGVLQIALSGEIGESSSDPDVDAALARLELRVCSVGGRFHVHRTSEQIKLEVSFPPGEGKP